MRGSPEAGVNWPSSVSERDRSRRWADRVIAASAGGRASETAAKATKLPRQNCRGLCAMILRLQPQIDRQIGALVRSEEHTSELQSLMRISYAVFCLKKKKPPSAKNKKKIKITNYSYITSIQPRPTNINRDT